MSRTVALIGPRTLAGDFAAASAYFEKQGYLVLAPGVFAHDPHGVTLPHPEQEILEHARIDHAEHVVCVGGQDGADELTVRSLTYAWAQGHNSVSEWKLREGGLRGMNRPEAPTPAPQAADDGADDGEEDFIPDPPGLQAHTALSIALENGRRLLSTLAEFPEDPAACAQEVNAWLDASGHVGARLLDWVLPARSSYDTLAEFLDAVEAERYEGEDVRVLSGERHTVIELLPLDGAPRLLLEGETAELLKEALAYLGIHYHALYPENGA